MSDVTAKKGKQKQTFTEKQWKEMPASKYGWIPVTDEPEEVTALRKQKEIDSQNTTANKPVIEEQPTKEVQSEDDTKPVKETTAKRTTKK